MHLPDQRVRMYWRRAKNQDADGAICQVAGRKRQVAANVCQVAENACQVAENACRVAANRCPVAANACRLTARPELGRSKRQPRQGSTLLDPCDSFTGEELRPARSRQKPARSRQKPARSWQKPARSWQKPARSWQRSADSRQTPARILIVARITYISIIPSWQRIAAT